jgi:alpha-1,2-mannosyltransferase
MDNGGMGRRLLVAAGVVLATVILTAAATRTIPPDNVCPDFIQFWTGASLLGWGQDPYEPALQAKMQKELGWDRNDQGLGMYDFLPYYYPPWLALLFLPFLALPYPLAKLTWLVVGGEMLVGAALLLKDSIRGVSALGAIVVVGAFGFSIKAVAMGQVAPLVLLFVSAAWWLLQRRRDLAAGCVLALLTVKPQLTVFFIGALLLWSFVRGRWRVGTGFGATLVALAAASTVAFPAWLPSMLAATRTTPMPSTLFPGLGATWPVVVGAFGVAGPLLYVAWAAVALPLLGLLAWMSLREETALEDLVGVALIVPFFVAPYARAYDFPILMVPALVLMGSRLPELSRLMMGATLTVLVGLHIVWITATFEPPVVGVRRPEFTYFWIPMLVAVAWLCCRGNGSREEASVDSNRPNHRRTT